MLRLLEPRLAARNPQGHGGSSPHSGLLQGAEAYLRSAAAHMSTHPEIAAMLRTVIQEWDELRSTTSAPQVAA